MGGQSSKTEEVVRAETMNQKVIKDQSFSIVNLHLPSSAGGVLIILLILGLAAGGYALARFKESRRRAATRAATTLGVLKAGSLPA